MLCCSSTDGWRFSLVLVVLCVAIYLLPTLRLRFVGTIGLLALACSAYFFIPDVNTRIDSIQTEAARYFEKGDIQTSGGERLYYWKLAAQMWRDAPLLGHGAGAFREELVARHGPGALVGYRHPHSEYLMQLAEFGLVGLGLFLAMVVIMLNSVRKIGDRWLAASLTVAILVFCLNAVTDASLHNDWEGFDGRRSHLHRLRQPGLLPRTMRFLPEPIRRMAHESVTQPLASPVACKASAYLAEVGEHKLGLARPFAGNWYTASADRRRYRIDRLRDGCRRGLWMYFGVPQIGDALMDLAPRSLFADAGVAVDLVTHAHLTDLFRGGPVVCQACCPIRRRSSGAAYDFVIVPSHKHRSLKMKQRYLPRQPWFSVHGRFTGPEFHRAEFAARRLADFLRLAPGPEAFAWHARQKLGSAQPFSGWRCGGTFLSELDRARAGRRARRAHVFALARCCPRAGVGRVRHLRAVGQRERQGGGTRSPDPAATRPSAFTTS